MITTAKSLSVACLVIMISGAAMAQSHHHMPTKGDAPSTRDFKAADKAMMRNMIVPYTGDADVDFRTHMIPHHQGAIDMAKVALARAKDAETKALAQAIVTDQEREIAEMKAWLRARGR